MSEQRRIRRVRYGDRLLAEAVASGERREGRARRDNVAEARAIAEATDFETRIVVRAAAMPDAQALQDATGRVSRTVGLVISVALLLGALAGAAAGRAGLASPREPVNIFLMLLALLGVQTVLLVVWMTMFVIGRRLLRRGSLGGLLFRAGQSIARRALKRPLYLDAIEASSRMTLGSRYGPWLLSGISHQFWALFNVGCLMVIVVLLSTNQYTFVWETTTRTEDQYVTLTRSIAAWPERLGFVTPTEEQIRSSRLVDAERSSPATNPDAPHDQGLQLAWSGMLVGCIVTYGLLPRAVLSLICMLGGFVARRRVRLDVHSPEFAVLRPILMPAAARMPVGPKPTAGHSTTPHDRKPVASSLPRDRPLGHPAIAGIEIERPSSSWPPAVHGLAWDDHGFIDSGAARREFVESLRTSHTQPRSIVMVCDLASTPDRGVQSFLRDVHHASGSPISVVLTGGQRLRARTVAVDMEQRIRDWRHLIGEAHAGVNYIIEVDLDHLTDQSAATLRRVVVGEQRDIRNDVTEPGTSFAGSTGLIASHSSKWNTAPTESEVLELFSAIQRPYRAAASGIPGRSILGIRTAGLGDIPAAGEFEDSIMSGVGAVLTRLPARLKSQPKWIAAGAVAGAFGCLAITFGAVPAAIGALPAWSAFGAAVGAGIRMAMPERSVKSDDDDKVNLTSRANAIRSAAMFAALLDLQGKPEGEITRVLDQTFDESSMDASMLPELDSTATAWLRLINDRYQRAISEERDP